jgi:hypothetical protein
MEKIIEFSDLIKTRISVVLLMPFWYLSLYLFNNDFYISSDLILKTVVCLCLSLPAELSITINLTKVFMNKGYKESDLKDLSDLSVAVLTKWLSVLIFFSYILQTFSSYYVPFLLLVCLFYFVPFLFFVFQKFHSKMKESKQQEG